MLPCASPWTAALAPGETSGIWKILCSWSCSCPRVGFLCWQALAAQLWEKRKLDAVGECPSTVRAGAFPLSGLLSQGRVPQVCRGYLCCWS